MSDFTITIVGTGVIGTSLGLALKQDKDPLRVLGHDKELAKAKAGVKQGAFDRAEWNLVNACEKADLIILAIPLSGIRSTLEAIAPYLKRGAVISDTAASKATVLDWAKELLPEHAHFVGGNPIVQTTGPGHEHASASLFQQKLYCLTPAPFADEQAVQLLVGLVKLVGAKPFFVDAAEHDGLVSAVTHLPALLSVSLVKTLASQNSWREIRKLAGGLFEQVSSAATGDPDAVKDDFLINRQNLIRWLDAYLAQLGDLRALLTAADETDETLVEIMDQAIVERQNWLTDYQQGRFIDPELKSPEIERRGLMKQLIGIGR